MNAEGGTKPESYGKDYYLESCGGSEFFKLYGPRVVKPALALALKKARLRAGMTALDAGCGRGELLYQLGEKGVKAVGMDFAEAALALAKKTGKAPVLRADAKMLPFAAASFDRIFFLGVMDHLHDWELEACFAEFKRVLRPGGLVLANTCANTEYYKRLTYAARKTMARALGLKEPRPPKSSEDETLHINEHNAPGLGAFFCRIGWEGEIDPRPNDTYCVEDLYGKDIPKGFPLRAVPGWKRAVHSLAFQGPLKRVLAREIFCTISPTNG